MNEPTLEAMLQRLIDLEQETRRRKIMSRVLLLLLGLIVLLGTTRSQERTTLDEIRAQKLMLMNKNGELVGLLSGDQPQVGLSLLDAEGKTRLEMFVDSNGEPLIKLYSARGKAGTTLGTNVALWSDEDGHTRLTLSAKKAPMVNLLDSTERVRITLGLTTDGEPGILFKDTAGKTNWRTP